MNTTQSRKNATFFSTSLAGESKSKNPGSFAKTIDALIEAVNAGSNDASVDLLTYVFKKEIHNTTGTADPEILEIITALQKIASANNPHAAYVLGSIYAGIKSVDGNVSPIINVSDVDERETLAIKYLEAAARLKHEEARIFLCDAFATGKSGCIKSNSEKWLSLTKFLADAHNQAAALDYALFRCGTLADGSEISEAKHIKMIIPQDHFDAMKYFLIATTGANLTIAATALQGIHRLLNYKSSPWYNKRQEVRDLLHEQATNGNGFVALCLAFYHCPSSQRPTLPASLTALNTLEYLVPSCECSISTVVSYFALTTTSQNKRVQKLAELFAYNMSQPSHTATMELRL